MAPVSREEYSVTEAAKDGNIRLKVFVPLALAGLILMTAFVFGVHWKTQEEISHSLNHDITELNATFEMMLQSEADGMSALLETLAFAQHMSEPFLAGDRAALYQWAKPRFENLRSGHDISHLYFIDTSRRCFLRVHQPELHGDVINRKTLWEAERTGKPFSGLELGPLGTLTLRTVMPWYSDGKLVGYLELGKEIQPIADRIVKMLNTDLVLLIRKEFLKQEDWKRGMTMLQHRAAWDQNPGWVIIYPAEREVPAVFSKVFSGKENALTARRFSAGIDRQLFELALEPLRDVDNRVIGGRVLMFDISGATKRSRKLVASVGALVLIVGVMLFALLYFYLGRLEKKLAETRRRLVEEYAASEQEQQRHFDELQKVREELERKVLERTADLSAANEMLHKEIAEKHQAEEAIRRSEERLRAFIEESKDAILTSTPDGRLLDINPAGVELFGYSDREEALQTSIREFYVDHADRDKFLAQMKQHGFVKNFELPLKRKDGKEIQIVESATAVRDEHGAITAFRRIMRDVTDLKRIERQLFQAQKMESIGTLAGGLAHDFNNILGGIMGYATLMKLKTAADHPFFSYIETIEKGAVRAAELTSQLLAFSRGGKFQIRPVAVNVVIADTLKLLARTIDKSIQIRTTQQEPLPAVEGDAGQLQQLLMNLCVNARDAMPTGGILSVVSQSEKISEEYLAKYSYARPGEYIIISVADTGVGMDQETRERIFEPFFTTKEPGKGTGLGLAMVYGIVKNHGGWVHVYSEPGSGTIFKVYLPACAKAAVEVRADQSQVCFGSETILVVDDEEIIRSTLKATLESFSYRVLLAHNGVQALKLYAEYKDEIDLVLLDIVMPIMGGAETLDKLKEINPKVKVLLSSGYSESGQAQAIIDRGVRGFIQKPYQIGAFLNALTAALGERKPD